MFISVLKHQRSTLPPLWRMLRNEIIILKTDKEKVSGLFSTTLSQGNQIVDEGKFLFTKVLRLINEEGKTENSII